MAYSNTLPYPTPAQQAASSRKGETIAEYFKRVAR